MSADCPLRNEGSRLGPRLPAAAALLSALPPSQRLVALAIATSLNFPLHGSWMVLTIAVVVTQVSVGGSLRATLDYVVGTLAGAVYAAAVGLLVPHVTALGQAVALTLAVHATLALAPAPRPSFSVAPFSAALVLLIGGALAAKIHHIGGPSACSRSPLAALVAAAVSNVGVPRTGAQTGNRSGVAAPARTWRTSYRRSYQRLHAKRRSQRHQDARQTISAVQSARSTSSRPRRARAHGFFPRDVDPAPLSRTLLGTPARFRDPDPRGSRAASQRRR